MAKVNPKIDLVFKKLFGSEENKDILLSLVNAILPQHQQIAFLTLKNPYNLADYTDRKLTILDIKAQDEMAYNMILKCKYVALIFMENALCIIGQKCLAHS